MREEIERALEKENLDRERGMAGEDGSEEAGSAGSVKSSAALMGDLEELRQKVEKYHARQDSEELATVRAKGEEVVLCYQYVSFVCIAATAFLIIVQDHILRLLWTAGKLWRNLKPQWRR